MNRNMAFLLLSLCVAGVFGLNDIRPIASGIEIIDLETADEFTLEQINSTAFFAVDQINEKVASGNLEFEDHIPMVPLELAEIMSASSQVTTGITYFLDLSTLDASGEFHTYNVQVGVQPWLPEPIKLIRTIFVK